MSYVPAQGDIIWLDFDPKQGKEIMKTRPALVISDYDYNEYGLLICLPITSKIKQYPFELEFVGKKSEGAILCDQVRSLDWRARNARFIETISRDLVVEAMEILALIIPNLKR